MLKRLAVSAVVAAAGGCGLAYLNQFMKDDPAWRGYAYRIERPFNVVTEFWLTFVVLFALTYFMLWWRRED